MQTSPSLPHWLRFCGLQVTENPSQTGFTGQPRSTTKAAKMIPLPFLLLPTGKWYLGPHASVLTVSLCSARNILWMWQKHSLCREYRMTIFHQQNLTVSRAQLQGILGTVVSSLLATAGQQVEGGKEVPAHQPSHKAPDKWV